MDLRYENDKVCTLSAHDNAKVGDAVFLGSTGLLLDDTEIGDAILGVTWCLLRGSCHLEQDCFEVGIFAKENVRVGLETSVRCTRSGQLWMAGARHTYGRRPTKIQKSHRCTPQKA